MYIYVEEKAQHGQKSYLIKPFLISQTHKDTLTKPLHEMEGHRKIAFAILFFLLGPFNSVANLSGCDPSRCEILPVKEPTSSSDFSKFRCKLRSSKTSKDFIFFFLRATCPLLVKTRWHSYRPYVHASKYS